MAKQVNGRGRPSSTDIPTINPSKQMATFASEKGAAFWMFYSETFRSAEEAYQKATSGLAKPLMELGAKAIELAQKHGGYGKSCRGEGDPKYSYVVGYLNALTGPFEARIKELSGQARVVDAVPSYSVLKAEMVRHMRVGSYTSTQIKRDDGSAIPQEEREISYGNPKECSSFSDMKRRTRLVESLRKSEAKGSQTPASGQETAEAGTAGERIAVNDAPEQVVKAYNDLGREINGVEEWNSDTIIAIVALLVDAKLLVARIGKETPSILPDAAQSQDEQGEEPQSASGVDQSEAATEQKANVVPHARRSKKRA